MDLYPARGRGTTESVVEKFPPGLKADNSIWFLCGTTEVVPFQNFDVLRASLSPESIGRIFAGG